MLCEARPVQPAAGSDLVKGEMMQQKLRYKWGHNRQIPAGVIEDGTTLASAMDGLLAEQSGHAPASITKAAHESLVVELARVTAERDLFRDQRNGAQENAIELTHHSNMLAIARDELGAKLEQQRKQFSARNTELWHELNDRQGELREYEKLLLEVAEVLGPEYDQARAQMMRVKILGALGQEVEA
jgi:hypothetical protein